MICASIRAETNEQAVELLRRAKEEGADLAELRLDFIRDPDPARLLQDRPLPVIATVRPKWEGGLYEGDEAGRVILLEAACREGAEYVDVEFRAYKDFRRGGAKLILSLHDFEKTPENLDRMVAKMKAMEPDVVKVAVTPAGTADVLRLVRLQKEAGVPSVFIPMGPWGEPVRILYRRYGGFLTYASVSGAEQTAPGQVGVAELADLYRANQIDLSTRLFGVVGNPVSQSPGPRLFNPAFRRMGADACYVRLPLDDGALLREMLEVLEIEGASVTIPHKETAAAQADEVEERMRPIGAVNTLALRDGKLRATNTDVLGSMEALRIGAERKWKKGVQGMRALIVGAGGASRALAWGLKTEGAEVTVANQKADFERAEKMRDEFGIKAIPLAGIADAKPQILLNATPLGMAPNENQMPPVSAALHADMVVFDSVYKPRSTMMLREARKAGAETVDGVEYFVRQANHQLRFWFGQDFPPDWVDEFKKSLG